MRLASPARLSPIGEDIAPTLPPHHETTPSFRPSVIVSQVFFGRHALACGGKTADNAATGFRVAVPRPRSGFVRATARWWSSCSGGSTGSCTEARPAAGREYTIALVGVDRWMPFKSSGGEGLPRQARARRASSQATEFPACMDLSLHSRRKPTSAVSMTAMEALQPAAAGVDNRRDVVQPTPPTAATASWSSSSNDLKASRQGDPARRGSCPAITSLSAPRSVACKDAYVKIKNTDGDDAGKRSSTDPKVSASPLEPHLFQSRRRRQGQGDLLEQGDPGRDHRRSWVNDTRSRNRRLGGS